MIEELGGTTPTVAFSYLDEPPSAWAEILGGLKQQGVSTIRTPILWGAHESMQGVRDFTKCSRLRLEKFFRLAQSHQLLVEAVLGFPPSRETFPAWALRLSKRAWIPTSVWNPASEQLTLTEIPSLLDPQLAEGFGDFLSEVLPILALYRAPEGPLRKIALDFGIYGADMNAVESPGYIEALQARYANLEEFNLRYQTSYRHFSSAATRPSLRALGEKRAWLGAFDYQWCRGRMLDHLRQYLLKLPSVAPVLDLLVVDEPSVLDEADADGWAVLLDSVLVQREGKAGTRLLAPGGMASAASTDSFRLTRYLREKCLEHAVPANWLPFAVSVPTFQGRLLTVVCGRYLTKASFRALENFLKKGGSVCFPFGLPQYDEDMLCHDLLPTSERRTIVLGGDTIIQWIAKDGPGAVYVPSTALDLHVPTWEPIARMATGILQGVPAA